MAWFGSAAVRSLAAVGVAVGLAVSTVPAVAADPAIERTEDLYASSSEVAGVESSVVRMHIPLPPEAGPRPEQCDWLSYLRFRDANGPADSADADRVLIAQPGIFEGAGAMESLARNTVRAAADNGRFVEFWALDRRSNCLEDNTGIQAALAAEDFSVAADYYYADAEVDGRSFAGFDAHGAHTRWLRNQGMAQTLRDQYEIMRAEVPDQQRRSELFLCGGHSLGGLITGYFAEWDFDGDAATVEDAGHNQCAGFFALDSAVTPGELEVHDLIRVPFLPPEVGAVLEGARHAPNDAFPVLSLPALINPETMNLLAMVGLAARLDPDGQSDVIPRLPQNFNVEATIRTLLGRDAAQLVTGQPRIQDAEATNAAVLGAILDDNSQPFGFLQASVGFAQGGQLEPKTLPVPHEVAGLHPVGQSLFGGAPKVAMTGFGPADSYTWADYDQITGEHAPYTFADREVTSIHELARNLSEPPLSFTEDYFPTRLAVDALNNASPDAMAHRLHRRALDAGPVLTVNGSEGIGIDPLTPSQNARTIVLPGYAHLDLVTAAARQNTGQPEQASTALAGFAATLVP